MESPRSLDGPPAGYIPALDGVRALAILLVLAFHSPFYEQFPGGFAGVDVFFTLSGFLITSLLLDEWRRTGDIRLGAFFMRRALRLLPALVLFLTVMWLAMLLLPPSSATRLATNPSQLVGPTVQTLGYVANWGIAFEWSTWPASLTHLWSLSLEEQFYILWPPLLVVLLRRKVPLARVLVGLTVAAVAATLWSAVVWVGAVSYERPFFSSDTRAAGLLVGVALAVGLAIAPERVRDRLGAQPWIAISALLASGLILDYKGANTYFGGLSIVHVATAALIAAILTRPSSHASSVLAAAPLVWVGRMSYSLYLWHYPAFFAVRGVLNAPPIIEAAIALAMTLLLAVASYYGVERPFLRLKSRLPRERPTVKPGLVQEIA